MSDTKIKYNLEPTYTVGDDAFAEYEGKYWRSNYKSEGFKAKKTTAPSGGRCVSAFGDDVPISRQGNALRFKLCLDSN